MLNLRTLATSSSFLSLAFVLGACSSTGLEESWIDPGTKELPNFKKVFVAYLGVDSAAQRLAEDSMAQHLSAPEVVKHYVLFPDARSIDSAKLRGDLRAKGCDGAIVMRLVGVKQQVSSTPMYGAPSYGTFGGYWGYAYPYAAEVHTDEIVQVETNVYALAEDKLLYSARSETFNPSSTNKMIEEIAAAVAEDLENKGLKR